MRDRKEKERKEQEDRDRAIEEAKQREIEAKQEEERKVREEKAREVTRRKEAVKQLAAVCEERGPAGCRYDRYFVEEFAKKIKTTEEIEAYAQRLRAYDADASAEDFKLEIERIIVET